MKTGGFHSISDPPGYFAASIDAFSSFFLHASSTLQAKFQYARENSSSFDFAYVSTLRIVSAVASRVFSMEVFDPDTLKTLRERKWEREVTEVRGRLDPTAREFCASTATAASTILLKLAGDGLRKAPEQIEYWLFYRMELITRYLYRQFTKRGVREEVLRTDDLSDLRAKYNGLSSRIAHAVGRPTLRSLANIELLLLKASEQVLARPPSPEDALRLKAIVFARLAKSLSQQEELDKVRSARRTEAEQKIATWDWLKRRGDLPSALPNPEDGVFPENLPDKERQALYNYVSGLVTKLLDQHVPDFFRTGLTGGAYELEGKDHLVYLATALITEVFVTQIGDPDRFAQAILYSQGEVLDLELDGFGMSKEELLFDTGQKILQAVSEGKSGAEIERIYKNSKLRQSPGGEEANLQKDETRKRLKDYFASLFLQMVVDDKLADSTLKADDPLIGAGTFGRNVLIQGLGFIVEYLRQLNFFATKKIEEYLASYFAGRIVDLIYHPSWKIILLQVIEELVEGSLHLSDVKANFSRADFDKVSSFLGKHFFGDIEASKMPVISKVQTISSLLDTLGFSFTEESMGAVLSSVFLYFKRDDLFMQFEKGVTKPSKSSDSFVKKAMELSVPTIKEVTLYSRVVDGLRKMGKSIDSDDKFWECYLRICLAQLVMLEADKRFPYPKKPTHVDLVTLRTKEIDKLLAMKETDLFSFLFEINKKRVETFEMSTFLA